MADCPNCADAKVPNDAKTCPNCGMSLSSSGLKVEGTNYLQVLVVAAALIVLIFGLLVAWRYLFA